MERYSFKNIWGIMYPILIYLFVGLFAEIGVVTLACMKQLLKADTIDEHTVETITKLVEKDYFKYSAYISFCTALVCIPLFIFLYMHDKKKSKERYTKLNKASALLVPLFGISTCVAFSNFIDIINVSELFKMYTEQVEALLYGSGFVMSFITNAIMAPVLEELLFRGLVYKRISRIFNKYVYAAIFSSLIFAVMHGNMVQGVYAFMVGIVLCFVYDKTKNILYPIMFHMSANVLASLNTEFGFMDFMYDNKTYFYALTFGCFAVMVVMGTIFDKVVNVSKKTDIVEER